MNTKKVGFVTLIGRPNAGKSTFLNALLDEKVSAVSQKAQTTQKTIRGIYNDSESQIIFQDVAGLHESEKKWNNTLNTLAKKSLEDTDLILRMIDSSRVYGKEEEIIDTLLTDIDTPVITVYSRIDLCENRSEFEKKGRILLSSTTKEGIPDILDALKQKLPSGELLYPEDIYTDQDVFTRISEIIREKVFLRYSQEIPHSVFVDISDFEEKEGLVRIHAEIFCETESQKRILIGSAGKGVQHIGQDARKDLEELFDSKVFLGLRVKVKKNWRKDTKAVQSILSEN